MKPLKDCRENAGSMSKGENREGRVFKHGGSDAKGQLYTGTADAVYASHTGQKVGTRQPANQELVKGYDFQENWGKK